MNNKKKCPKKWKNWIEMKKHEEEIQQWKFIKSKKIDNDDEFKWKQKNILKTIIPTSQSWRNSLCTIIFSKLKNEKFINETYPIY